MWRLTPKRRFQSLQSVRARKYLRRSGRRPARQPYPEREAEIHLLAHTNQTSEFSAAALIAALHVPSSRPLASASFKNSEVSARHLRPHQPQFGILRGRPHRCSTRFRQLTSCPGLAQEFRSLGAPPLPTTTRLRSSPPPPSSLHWHVPISRPLAPASRKNSEVSAHHLRPHQPDLRCPECGKRAWATILMRAD